ncbi:MAG: succinate dehydrogenase, cytochrome b556 subunit [Gammaproteobacteria bacterium]|nr:succinate dehydrogenase, cytochrome b556 subunit [Gammaproteobacteria bacterium]
MTQRERPLSPFMLGSYYRFQVTSVMSLLHRATGVVLSLGAFVLTAWLVAVMAGPEVYARFVECVGSLPGRIVLAGIGFSLIYHLLNGIRHLAWDLGYGLTLKGAYTGGTIVAVLAAVFTLLLWYFGFSAGGAT